MAKTNNTQPKRKRRTKAEIEAAKANDPVKVQRAPKKGLGDHVETITKLTGIKAFVEFLNGGEPCGGCEKRKKWLNDITKGRKAQPLTVDQVQFIESIKDKKNLRASEVLKLYQTYDKVYNIPYTPPGSCASCVRDRINDLTKLYEIYTSEQ